MVHIRIEEIEKYALENNVPIMQKDGIEFLTKYIKAHCKTKDVKLAVLFDKKCARKYNLEPDFSCFEIDDKFIIGFGLDYCGLYRNLDYIGYFE